MNSFIAGIDDATKCPCIGSIFVAGVVADPKTIKRWKKLGVKDSKLVTPKKRTELAKIIQKTAQSYTIQEVTPSMIDNKALNLNQWEMIVVCHAIQDLQKASDVFHQIYIDNWEVTEKHFHDRLNSLLDESMQNFLQEHNVSLDRDVLRQFEYIAEHYADETYTVVSAASILAKVHSDLQYVEYKEQYGDFGSGSPADPKTRLFVWHHRKEPLPIIRTSWQTYKTLSQLDRIEDDPIYARILQKKAQKKSAADSSS